MSRPIEWRRCPATAVHELYVDGVFVAQVASVTGRYYYEIVRPRYRAGWSNTLPAAQKRVAVLRRQMHADNDPRPTLIRFIRPGEASGFLTIAPNGALLGCGLSNAHAAQQRAYDRAAALVAAGDVQAAVALLRTQFDEVIVV